MITGKIWSLNVRMHCDMTAKHYEKTIRLKRFTNFYGEKILTHS